MAATQRTGRIEIRDLTLQYRNTPLPAVDRVALTVEPGEFMTLLGPSGSGKTTTLNLLAGFLRPDSGSIRVNGEDLVAVPPNRRGFGMVFQDYALFPHMSVFDNVAFPLRQRRTSAADVRHLVDDVLERFGLEGFGSRKPADLSGGQRQRVALARATVFSPSVLLLDEPLGALDRKLRAQLQLEIKKLHRELGLTFVFVTHDQDEAMFLSDKIAVFNRGTIERVGTPTDLYDDPGTRFVAEFLGEANIFEGAADGVHLYRWAGERLRTAGADAPSGSALMVRPEHVRLSAERPVADEWNSVRATVQDVSHLGAATRVDLRFSGGQPGIARVSSSTSGSVSAGESVWASWPVAAQRIVSGGTPAITTEEEAA